MISASANSPTVSVLIANFNYGRFLGTAIESALAQSCPVREVVVCDDGSTDDSCRVAERYAARYGSVRLVRKPNGGEGSAYSAAFAASSGEIVCLLDSDDVWKPNKVARMIEIFSSVAEAGWVRHRLRLTDESLRPLDAVLPACRGSRRVRNAKYAHLEKTVAFSTTGLSLRRELAERLFPIPEALFRRGPDLYLDYMCGLLGATGYSLDEELGLYRRHTVQMSGCGGDFRAVVEAESAMARAFLEVHPCQGYVPTHVYKHEMIAAYMRSGHRLEPLRLRLCAGGLASVGLLLREGCTRLALLQLTKLVYGFLLPRSWIRRQLKRNAWGAV
ncbi:MAG: glycosyltransferase [Bryobacteraceae bacterium]|jgi:hypothetical protein